MSDQILSDAAAAAAAVATLRREFEEGRIHEMSQTISGDGVREPLAWELRIKVYQK